MSSPLNRADAVKILPNLGSLSDIKHLGSNIIYEISGTSIIEYFEDALETRGAWPIMRK